MRLRVIIGVAVALILGGTVVAAEAAPAPDPYVVDGRWDPVLKGALVNHEWCLRYTSVRPLRSACMESGQNLQRQTVRATAELRTAVPRRNRACTRDLFLPRQFAALTAHLIAGRQRTMLAVNRAKQVEAEAEALQSYCLGPYR